MVDIFRGKRRCGAIDARAAGARRNPRGEAALELGLLEIRHGRRDEGWKILDPIMASRSNRASWGPDEYYRLARASRASLEFLLANDAYQQTAKAPRADIQTEWGDLFLQRHRAG